MSKKEQVEKALRVILGDTKAIAGQGTSDLNEMKVPIEEIIAPNFMNNTPYAESNVINVPDGFNGIKIHYQTGTGFLGGLEAKWVNEGQSIGVDKAQFGSRNIPLCKLAIVVPLTGEINQDVVYLSQYLRKAMAKAIKYEVNRSIIYGEHCVMGILGACKAATGFVDTGVYASISEQIEEMYSSFYSTEGGVWIFSKDKYRELIADYEVEANVVSPWGSIYGMPIVVPPYMETGDIVLGDFSQYWIAQKEMREAVSGSVYFDTDQLALRMVLRIGGRQPYANGWIGADGRTVYPFVALSDMEQSSEGWKSSSSSSSQQYSSSSDSSSSSSSVDSSSSSSMGESSSSSSS